MGLWNLGSISEYVYSQVDNIPVAVSGILIQMAHQQVQYAEVYTGNTIGSVNIAERYQPALSDLMLGALLNAMSVQGADVSSVSLGDFSESKGAASNTQSTADALRVLAEQKLTSIGRQSTARYYKAWG